MISTFKHVSCLQYKGFQLVPMLFGHLHHIQKCLSLAGVFLYNIGMKTILWAVVLSLLIVGAYIWSLNGKEGAVPISQNLTWPQLVARHQNELRDPVNETEYSCADNKTIFARVEVNRTPGKAEVFLKDGTKMLLNQTISASGVRYANSGESFVFWTKGDTAFVQEGPIQSYSNCIAK